MEILKIQVLRGPNIWSTHRQNLIQMRLDLKDYADYMTNADSGFTERLASLMPTLGRHAGLDDVPGTFFECVKNGISLAQLIERVAIELQVLAEMQVDFGRTKPATAHGVYNVVFAYTNDEAGTQAAKAAVRFVEGLMKGEPYDFQGDIIQMQRTCEHNCFGPSTQSIVDEALRRNIPYLVLSDNSTVQLGYGANQSQIRATITSKTSSLAVDIAGNKERTKRLLDDFAVPVAKGGICATTLGLQDIIEDIEYPIVTKPLNGNHGKGVTANITNWDQAVAGFEIAKQFGNRVIVEKYITGFDFRLLVINKKLVAATKRVPAHVVGDGKTTIAQLIEQVNDNPKRGNSHEKVLTKIKITRDTEDVLEKLGYSLDTVPAENEVVYLKSTANISTGGSAIDVTDEVHPANVALAETIARVIGLDICGIDIMAETLSLPIKQNGGAILEVNAAPGFRMHLAPTEGQPRNVAAPVIDMLFPDGKPGRIPIIAITGTNGKTTTTRLLSHIVKNAGLVTGFTTTDGIYINNILQERGDTTGPQSARHILQDSSVEFAILETARGGLLRSGLGFDKCDVGVITNVKADHLGLSDINTVEDLADVKSVVVKSVKKDGWAVLNAEDEHCVRIAGQLECNVAFFSMDPNNSNIQKSLAGKKPVAIYENGLVVIIDGDKKIEVENVANIPVTMQGKVKFMIANVLAASLAAYTWGFDSAVIGNALTNFTPDYEHAPGRLNIFKFNNFNILVDYAHNPHGFSAVEDYLQHVEAPRKIGIISGVGDRRDEDIRECGYIAGRMFDHIIIRKKKDMRGRVQENVTGLLLDGINAAGRNVTHDYVDNELDAVRHAMAIAKPGEYIISLTDDIPEVVEMIKEYQQKELAETDA